VDEPCISVFLFYLPADFNFYRVNHKLIARQTFINKEA
jgi:hypothetical protein